MSDDDFSYRELIHWIYFGCQELEPVKTQIDLTLNDFTYKTQITKPRGQIFEYFDPLLLNKA